MKEPLVLCDAFSSSQHTDMLLSTQEEAHVQSFDTFACGGGVDTTSGATDPCLTFRAELPVFDPPSNRGVKRPAQQISNSTQDDTCSFRSHCERLLRAEQPCEKRLKSAHEYENSVRNVRLTFEDLPSIMFDSSAIAMKKFVILDEPNSDSDSQTSNDNDNDRPWTSGIYFLVGVVNILAGGFATTEPRTLYYNDYLTFGEDVYKVLPASKCFFVWIQVFTSKGSMITEAVSHSVTLLHDGLKESPPGITADVCFFPQKVVIDHLNNCNSKATLSKRHKKGKLKEGARWCRNPSCGAKATCSCQAYPSRILKKYIREVKDLLERDRSVTSAEAIKAAQDLYTTLNITADQQTKKLPTYESFLQERIRRWRLFLRLKDFASSPMASPEVRDKMDALSTLLPPM